MNTAIAPAKPKIAERISLRACDCCGSLDNKFITTKRGYKLYQCLNCGLIFVFPQPTPEKLAGIYTKASGYFATANTNLQETSPDYALHLNKILSENGIYNGRFLDVGCSTGALLYHMRQFGWEVAGTELNPDAAQIARQHNLDVTLAELERCPFDKNSFDVIYMGDVIEHLRFPRQTLLTAHNLLRPGGLIVVKTANTKCGFAVSTLLLAKMFRFPWPQSEAPYHLYDFYPQTLSRLLLNTGFEVVTLNCSGRVSFLYNVGATGFFDDLKTSMRKTGKYRLNLRFLANIPKLIIVAGIILPFYIWGRISDRLFRTGSEVTIVGRQS